MTSSPCTRKEENLISQSEVEIKYGFYDRLTAEFPSQLIVDITEVCNLACIHCPHPTFKKSEHYSAAYLDEELNAKMTHEVQKFGQGYTQYIRYTSAGEPLVHPKAFEMMAYAKKHSGVLVALTTNGKLLREAQSEKLIAAGVDLVDISLDAHTPETYEKVRVHGNLNVTRPNVERLIQLKNEARVPLKVVVSFVEQPENRHETKDFEAYWKDKGADYVVIRRLHSAAGCKTDIGQKLWQQLQDAGTRKPCVYPWERLVLGPRGHLSFCPADWTHGSTFVDFRTTTIQEAWKGPFMSELRQAHLKNDYSCHKFCGQCPDWSVTRWPGEGRAYADMVDEFRRQNLDIITPSAK